MPQGATIEQYASELTYVLVESNANSQLLPMALADLCNDVNGDVRGMKNSAIYWIMVWEGTKLVQEDGAAYCARRGFP
jgi:hypothetical protein